MDIDTDSVIKGNMFDPLGLGISRLAFSDEALVDIRDRGIIRDEPISNTTIDTSVDTSVLQYILVRTDLNMSAGKIAAQVAHASVECYRKLIHRIMTESMLYGNDNKHYYMKIHNKWSVTGTKKVVLNAGSMFNIDAIVSSIDDEIVVHEVVDQGLTEVEPETLTCIGVGPDYAYKLKPLFQDLEIL